MEKRVVFRSAWLPYALVAPQIVITILFFFWPALQAVWYSFQLQDAFGLRTDFIWVENYRDLLAQPDYYRAMATTAIFSVFNELLVRPLPVQSPHELVNLAAPGLRSAGARSCSNAGSCDEIFSYPMYRDLAAGQTAFAGLAAHLRALARGRVARLGDDLLQKIDIAISEVTACTASTHASIAAIVGLRQN